MGNSLQHRLEQKNPYRQGQVNKKINSLDSVKRPILREVDLKFLSKMTNESNEKIKDLFEKFHKNNKNGKLNKTEFKKLYTDLRPEPPERLEKISEFVFNAFCLGNRELLSFDEFAVTYLLFQF